MLNNLPACSPKHRGRCSPDHLWIVSTYRDARDARDKLRESEVALQLEDDDFAATYPRVTFKQWLMGHAGRNVELEAAS